MRIHELLCCVLHLWQINFILFYFKSRCALTQTLGEIAAGVPPTDAKTCFVFLLSIQRGLSAICPAPILSIFEIKDVNRCAHA